MIHTRKVQLLIGGVALCVLIGVGTIFYKPFTSWIGHKTPVSSSQKTTKTAQQVRVARIDDAQALIAKGDKAGAVALYDSAIQATSDPAEKQTLLITKVGICIDAGLYDQAVEAGLAADKMKSTITTLGYTARAYEAKGDVQNAISYYTKAIDAINNQSGQKYSTSALLTYRQHLNALQGKH